MDVAALIRRKRDGGSLTEPEIQAFVAGCVEGSIPEGQAAAMLMAIFFQGLEESELVPWTEAMVDTGERLEFGSGSPLVDKHSTGGVGDKLSLTLAPALAACGVRVPMISGRALGHTGGTLCKLESIPGYQVNQRVEVLGQLLEDVGYFIVAQAPTLVPGDRLFYGMRNATGTVESVPLIASSILSKKRAEGLDALVLDVKAGTGSHFPNEADSIAFATRLVELGGALGMRTLGIRTSMNQPLGQAVGNALEVREALDCLRGEGPEDLRELTEVFGAALLESCGQSRSREEGRSAIVDALQSGAALERFERGVRAQGGTLADLPEAPAIEPWHAQASGRLGVHDCKLLSHASAALGGLRDGQGNPPDPAVGLVWTPKRGDEEE